MSLGPTPKAERPLSGPLSTAYRAWCRGPNRSAAPAHLYSPNRRRKHALLRTMAVLRHDAPWRTVPFLSLKLSDGWRAFRDARKMMRRTDLGVLTLNEGMFTEIEACHACLPKQSSTTKKHTPYILMMH